MRKSAHIAVTTPQEASFEPPVVSEAPATTTATSGAENAPGEFDTAKRKPGRPKGYPKSGGRKKGKPNKLTGDVRKYILEEGHILERLFKIARGHKVRTSRADGTPQTVIPPLSDQLKALIALLDRAVPSLKSQSISGPDDGPIEINSDTPQSRFETARRICFLLSLGGLVPSLPDGAATDTTDDDGKTPPPPPRRSDSVRLNIEILLGFKPLR